MTYSTIMRFPDQTKSVQSVKADPIMRKLSPAAGVCLVSGGGVAKNEAACQMQARNVCLRSAAPSVPSSGGAGGYGRTPPPPRPPPEFLNFHIDNGKQLQWL